MARALLDKQFENTPGRRGESRALEGSDFTAVSVLSEIDRLPVGIDDALFCFISTHGGYDTKVGHFMSTADGVLVRRDVMARLKQKSSRLTILITDASQPNTLPDDVVTRTAAADKPTHALTQLLFYYQGAVDINSSSCRSNGHPNGEFSWYWNRSDSQGGGLFTRSFCDSGIYAPANGGWDSFIRDVKERMRSELPSAEQNPMWFED